MIYSHFWRTDRTGWETRFYIRESREYLQSLTANPVVQLRAGIIFASGTILVPVLARVEARLYESWMDYHRTNSCLCFADLIHQDGIAISLYDTDLLRQLWVHNELRPLFELAMREINHVPAWGAGTFYSARYQAYQHYPTAEMLWAALTPNGAPVRIHLGEMRR
ncbi:MAG: hypothetical protein M1546_09575 [Chloroflexi bacterium]|nr:hypothetical protein [Chloroflexota bacterium]